jgi:hypothetical protein
MFFGFGPRIRINVTALLIILFLIGAVFTYGKVAVVMARINLATTASYGVQPVAARDLVYQGLQAGAEAGFLSGAGMVTLFVVMSRRRKRGL